MEHCVSSVQTDRSRLLSARARIVSAAHITFYVISTALVLDTITSHWKSGEESERQLFIAMATLFVSSHIIGNVVSLAMACRKTDFSAREFKGIVCILTHMLQLGPIWRFLRLAFTSDLLDIRELNIVRVIMVMISDVMFVVLQTCISYRHKHQTWMPILAIVTAFTSLCFAIAVHNIQWKERIYHKKTEKGRCSVCVTRSCEVIACVLILASRCLMLAMFIFMWSHWLVLFIAGHCLVVVVSLYVINEFTREKQKISVKVLMFWSIQVIEWIEVDIDKVTKWDLSFSYTVMGLENLAVATAFLFHVQHEMVNYLLSVSLMALFVVGVTIKVIRYRYDLNQKSLIPNNEASDNMPPIPNSRSFEHGDLSHHSKLKQFAHSAEAKLYDTINVCSNNNDKIAKTRRPMVPVVTKSGSGFNSKADDAVMTLSKQGQAKRSSGQSQYKHKAHVHGVCNPVYPVPDSPYSNFDNINMTISEYEVDFTDTSKILPMSPPKLKLREGKRSMPSESKMCKKDGASTEKKTSDKAPSFLKDRIKLHPKIFNEMCLSASTRSFTMSDTQTHTCRGDLCEICDYTVFSTSSSDLDSFTDIDFGDLDLSRTWPPSKRLTIENITNLPKNTFTSHEYVKLWLSKSLGHVQKT